MAGHVGILVDSHHLAHVLDDILVLHVQLLQRLGGQSVLLLDQGKQQVLGSHIGLMERAGLVLRQHQDLAGLVGEFVKCHRRSFALGRPAPQVCRFAPATVRAGPATSTFSSFTILELPIISAFPTIPTDLSVLLLSFLFLRHLTNLTGASICAEEETYDTRQAAA